MHAVRASCMFKPFDSAMAVYDNFTHTNTGERLGDTLEFQSSSQHIAEVEQNAELLTHRLHSDDSSTTVWAKFQQ